MSSPITSQQEQQRTRQIPLPLAGALLPAGSGIVAVGFFAGRPRRRTLRSPPPGTIWRLGPQSQPPSKCSELPPRLAPAPARLRVNLVCSRLHQAANVAGTPFSGKNVYVAIGSGATLAASQQWVVFKSTTTFADEPTPSVNAFLTDPAAGTPPAGTCLAGALSTTTSAWYTTGPLANIQMSSVVAAGVPEPTVALLGALGLGIGFIRRRR